MRRWELFRTDRGTATINGMHNVEVVRGVHVKQRQLLRIILIAMLSLLALNIALAVLLAGPAFLTLRLLGPSLCALAGGGIALWLLARKRFYAAALLAIASFLIGDTWEFTRAGLAGNEISLLMFIAPVILAGLVLHRAVLYPTFGISLLAVLTVHVLEVSRAPADSLEASGAVLLFSLILTLLVLFFDRFGITLRNALLSQAAIADENARLYEETRMFNQTLEQRVQQRTAQLEEANRELEAFSYSVSHDLRAPLRGINGFSQTLLEDYGKVLDTDGRKYLQRIATGAERMGQLINDLLDLARLSRKDLTLEAVDLGELAQEVVSELRQHEPERQVKVEIAAGLEARGDARLLRIALENLLGNAWKFTAGRAQACIEVGRSDTHAAFFVRDNGAGFDMDYAGKLFEPFQRLHSPGTYEGTGIGLATARRIIKRHGGRIWANGEEGKGATFYFTLPAPSTQRGNA